MANLRDAFIFQDFTVWINGIGKIGQAPQFQPPPITITTQDFRGGGMDGVVEIPTGFDKLDFSFELFTWDVDIFENIGFGPGSMDVPVTFRGYLITPGGAEKGVIIDTKSLIKSVTSSAVTPGDKVTLTVNLSANKYTHEVDGQVINQIDVYNKVFIVDGVDRSANARNILGFNTANFSA